MNDRLTFADIERTLREIGPRTEMLINSDEERLELAEALAYKAMKLPADEAECLVEGFNATMFRVCEHVPPGTILCVRMPFDPLRLESPAQIMGITP